MKFFTTLIIFLTICAKVTADFSEAFIASYVAHDVSSKIGKKIKKTEHRYIKISDCDTITTLPTDFEKDIVIPMETSIYQEKMKYAHNDTRFNWKPKSSKCNNEMTCKYLIVNEHADLAVEFIVNIIFLLIVTNMLCVCICGTEKDSSELAGVICGGLCHTFVSALLSDDE